MYNNRAGCNKRAGWKNLQNLYEFKNQIRCKTFQVTKKDNNDRNYVSIIFLANSNGLSVEILLKKPKIFLSS